MLGEFIDVRRATQLGNAARRSSEHWLELGSDDFAQRYNRQPFLIRHRLQSHPLFQRSAVFDLCRRHPSIGLRIGKVPVTEDFAQSFSHFRGGLTLEDALAQFEERGAYIVITNPERDPVYRDAIEGLLGEIAAAIEDIDPHITWYSTYIFISSHDSLTPYHMDREMNFLCQICGTKHAKLWDPADHQIMTEAQKDELLSYASELRPPYHPSFESKAVHFELQPGLGLHHPFIAPHVISTASTFSISLALTYRTRRTDTWTAAHRLNHALRQRGWSPAQIGVHPQLDAAKASVVRALRSTRAAARAVGHLVRH